MTRSYSLDLRVRVAGFVEAGHSCRAAARHFGVSDSFAIKLMQRRGQSGSPAPARQGRPRGTGKLAPYAAFLIQAVETKPDITMPDLAARLWDEHGVVAAPATGMVDGGPDGLPEHRTSVLIADFQRRSPVEQQFHCVEVPAVRGEVQRGLSGTVLCGGIDSAVEQELHDGGVAVDGGVDQCPPALCGAGAGVSLDQVEPAQPGRRHERHPGAPPGEQPGGLGAPVF